MIRTVIQQGDASRPTHTAEFDEKTIVYMELVETEGAPPELVVCLQPERKVTISDPAVIAQLWKEDKKKKR